MDCSCAELFVYKYAAWSFGIALVIGFIADIVREARGRR